MRSRPQRRRSSRGGWFHNFQTHTGRAPLPGLGPPDQPPEARPGARDEASAHLLEPQRQEPPTRPVWSRFAACHRPGRLGGVELERVALLWDTFPGARVVQRARYEQVAGARRGGLPSRARASASCRRLASSAPTTARACVGEPAEPLREVESPRRRPNKDHRGVRLAVVAVPQDAPQRLPVRPGPRPDAAVLLVASSRASLCSGPSSKGRVLVRRTAPPCSARRYTSTGAAPAVRSRGPAKGAPQK